MNKKVEDSRIEWYKTVHYEDINPNGKLFGGKLLSWMDEVAGITAIKHSGLRVTTAAIDNLQFKKSLELGDMIVIVSKITYVGNTSMEVRVDVFKEDPVTGTRQIVNRAFFTEVGVNEEGRPTRVPYGIDIITESEKADYEGAIRRSEFRRLRKEQGF